MRRRDFLVAGMSGLAPLAPSFRAVCGLRLAQQREPLADIERRVACRLGVAALDTGSGRRLAYRSDERFPMCSTFKLLLVAQVLSRCDASREQLSRVVPYGPGDLLEYAPVTRAHVAEGGMSVAALAEAAIEYSDNTAANLLLGTVGGPAAFTGNLRNIGDDVTRLDRVEPDLNSAMPGDPRDTTTPNAMLGDMERLLVGRRLAPASRERLLGWLVANTTGGARIRAGLPPDWRVGDKTGTGAHGATNDVAIVWPAGRSPVLVAAYLTETDAAAGDRDAALAAVGRLVARWAGG